MYPDRGKVSGAGGITKMGEIKSKKRRSKNNLMRDESGTFFSFADLFLFVLQQQTGMLM
jgi:hypothetical protein